MAAKLMPISVHEGKKPLTVHEVKQLDIIIGGKKQPLTIHEEKKPFKCPICSARFTKQYNLTNHMQDRHSNGSKKPFRCEVCDARFSQMGALDRHTYIIHKGKLSEGLPKYISAKKSKHVKKTGKMAV